MEFLLSYSFSTAVM